MSYSEHSLTGIKLVRTTSKVVRYRNIRETKEINLLDYEGDKLLLIQGEGTLLLSPNTSEVVDMLEGNFPFNLTVLDDVTAYKIASLLSEIKNLSKGVNSLKFDVSSLARGLTKKSFLENKNYTLSLLTNLDFCKGFYNELSSLTFVDFKTLSSSNYYSSNVFFRMYGALHEMNNLDAFCNIDFNLFNRKGGLKKESDFDACKYEMLQSFKKYLLSFFGYDVDKKEKPFSDIVNLNILRGFIELFHHDFEDSSTECGFMLRDSLTLLELYGIEPKGYKLFIKKKKDAVLDDDMEVCTITPTSFEDALYYMYEYCYCCSSPLKGHISNLDSLSLVKDSILHYLRMYYV